MKIIQATEYVDVFPDCKVTIDKKFATVTGPRGTLTKCFKHTRSEMCVMENGKIRVDFWWMTKKEKAVVRTVCTHLKNLMKGVTIGYKYIMKSVYAHFPINVVITNSNKTIEIRNFLGEKIVRTIQCHNGCTVEQDGKDQIKVEGNDLELVSLTCARIQQITTVKNKDIRKFLDGIYVAEKTNIVLE